MDAQSTLIMAVVVLLVACLSWAITKLRMTARFSALEAQLYEATTLHESAQTQLASRDDALTACRLEIDELKGALNTSEKRLVAMETKASTHDDALQQLQTDLNTAHQALDESRARLHTMSESRATLEATFDQKEKNFAERLAQLKESRNLLKTEFENLAQSILDQKGKALSEQHKQALSTVLSPIKEEMKQFKDKVETLHRHDAEQRVALRTELKNLQALNQEITGQAEQLTKALQGQKKMQGNWGELMLENVLERAGLDRGRDYAREVSVTTEDGRQRPDVVVYLPQEKHLIIDAKTSLAAYTRYVNAEDDESRDVALKAHASAVGDRITELADRNYFKLSEFNSPEIVIMFIPIESAYIEAIKQDESLFQRAIDQNVLVATPTTLLTSLNIVRQLWRFEAQNEHTAQLAQRAERFYSKLNTFLHTMLEVQKRIDGARSTFDKALGQFYSGKGNLIKQAAEFKQLGVSVQKELPRTLIEQANLELEVIADSAPSMAEKDD
ncbi:MAG: DNA recombination protein RmuC [Myxococcota bacterium]|nr:DNA recombination protein RmuC [Myxococcota bacterium]